VDAARAGRRGGQSQASRQIHALHARLFKQGMEEGVFRREDPEFCASILSGMDQVLLADWVAKGMKPSRDQLVDRLEGLVLRTFGTGKVKEQANGK